MKIYEIQNFLGSYETIKEISMPIKATYQLVKINKWALEQMEFLREELCKIIDKYAEKDENGDVVYQDDAQQSIKIQEDKINEANDAYSNLVTMDYDDYPSLSLELIENITLTAKETENLMPFILD